MKKLLLFLSVLTFSAGIRAYHLTVENKGEYPVKVKAHFGGSLFCPSREFNVRPDRKREINVKRCCLKKIEVRQTKGDNLKHYNASPQTTGAGLGCKDQKFTVYRNPNGSLTIEN